jgi:hypothetical protein
MDNFERGKAPWYGIRNEINSIEIKSNVESIGSYAFEECSYITRIEISNNIKLTYILFN